MERIVHNSMLNFLLSNNLLSAKQFGFRPRSSTQRRPFSMSPVTGTSHWRSSLAWEQCFLIWERRSTRFLIRASSALWRLLASLVLYRNGSPVTSQTGNKSVVLNGHSSAIANVTSGVPRGSILGPLLFIIYMGPLTKMALSPGTKLILYADDILYRPIDTKHDVAALQLDVDRVVNWVASQSLTLTSQRPSCLSSQEHTILLHVVTLLVDNILIQQVDSLSYLGVTITNDLKWSAHISKLCARAKSKLGISTKLTKRLFHTYSEHSYRYYHAWTTAAASGTPRSQATYTNSNQSKDLLPNYVPNNGLPLINPCCMDTLLWPTLRCSSSSSL